MDELIRFAGSSFSPEQYLFWTRIQCGLWTVADVLIVFYLLRLGDLARRITGHQRHVFSYIVLLITVLMALLVPLAQTGQQIFVVEVAITVPHFLIILGVLVRDGSLFASALYRLVTTSAT